MKTLLTALTALTFATPLAANAGDLSSEFNAQSGVAQLCKSVPAALLRPTDPTGPENARIVQDGVVYGSWGSCDHLEPLGRVGVQHSYQRGYQIHTRLFKFENGQLVQYTRNTSGKVFRRVYSSQCGGVRNYPIPRGCTSQTSSTRGNTLWGTSSNLMFVF